MNRPPQQFVIHQNWQQAYEAAYAAQSWAQGTPAVMLAPWHFQIHWQAKDWHKGGQYQLAVVLSQVACDLHTEAALSQLMRPLGDARIVDAALRGLRRPISLASDDTRKVWAEVTGERPAGDSALEIAPASWWTNWQLARKLRHDIVHDGKKVSPEESEAAMVASDRYIEHVLEVLQRGPMK